jgi:SinI restriction endonuclease
MVTQRFDSESIKYAEAAIQAVDGNLKSQFLSIVRFLSTQPDLAKKLAGKNPPAVGSRRYLDRLASDFVKGRQVSGPKPPETVPDSMVSKILVEYFDVPKTRVEKVTEEHLLAMASEGIVGNVLEHYIASVAEPHGWTWCSGNMVLAVDFIKAPTKPGGDWKMLQIKNRSNSENSSSSKIRAGTQIEKWYRVDARTGSTKWDNFPDMTVKSKLSETSFGIFVSRYLNDAKGES